MTARWLMVLWLAWGTCAAIDEAAIPSEPVNYAPGGGL
jgi:hypothetical protein